MHKAMCGSICIESIASVFSVGGESSLSLICVYLSSPIYAFALFYELLSSFTNNLINTGCAIDLTNFVLDG